MHAGFSNGLKNGRGRQGQLFQVFLEHPSVAEAALIGKPHEKWGEIGLMFVVPEKGTRVSQDELKEFCRERLARYKVPKEIIFTESLPHSPYGKVMKMELMERIKV